MAYWSGEFNPGLPLCDPWPGAACVSAQAGDPTLSYAADAGGRLFTSTVNMSAIAAGSCSQPAAWSTSWLSVEGWIGMPNYPCTQAKPGLAAVSTPPGSVPVGSEAVPAPLLVWNNGSNNINTTAGLFAGQLGAGTNPQKWAGLVQLCSAQQGNPLLTPGSAAAAIAICPWGPNIVFVACPDVYKRGLYLGVFDTNQRDLTNKQWVPRHEYTWTTAQLSSGLPGLASIGNWVSLDWFTSAPSSGTSSTPTLWLALSLTPVGTAGPVIGYLEFSVGTDQRPYLVNSAAIVWDVMPSGPPLTVVRDPAGRLRAYAAANRTMTTWTFATITPPTAPAGGRHALPLVRTDTRSAPNAGSPPAVAYVMSAPQTLPVPTTATGLDDELHAFAAEQRTAYELAVYGSQMIPPQQGPLPPPSTSTIQAQLTSFGYALSLSGGAALSTSPDSAAVTVVTGIIDGPIPIADGNLVSTQDLAAINYSATTSGQVSHDSTFSWMAGFKFEAHPSVGWGPAAEISLASGTGDAQGTMTGTTMGDKTISVSSAVRSVATGELIMNPIGTALCAGGALNYVAYRWYEALGTPLVGRPSGGPASDGSVRLYGQGSDGSLWFFLGSPFVDYSTRVTAWQWAADNLSSEVNPLAPVKIAGNPAASLLPATGGSGAVYARSGNNELLRFRQDAQGWHLDNLTTLSKTGILSDPAPVLIEGIEHVIGCGAKGDILDFEPVDQGTCKVADQSATQTPPFTARANPVTVPTTDAASNGDGTAAVSMIFPSNNGHTLVLYNPRDQPHLFQPGGAWTHQDLSQDAKPSGGLITTGDAVNGVAGVVGNGKLSGGQSSHLIRWYWTPQTWVCQDVSSEAGNSSGGPFPSIVGTPAQPRNGQSDVAQVAARRPDGHLLLFSQDGSTWRVQDLSVAADGGTVIAGDPTMPDGEHIYAVDTAGHLLAFVCSNNAWVTTDLGVASSGSAVIIADGTSGQAGQAASCSAVVPTTIGTDTPASYEVFGPTPGDITSYTAWSWTQRMNRLAEANPQSDLQSCSDYIDDIVLPNAYQFVTDSKPVGYLEATWGPNTQTNKASYVSAQTSYTEHDWTLDGSLYLGGGYGGTGGGPASYSFMGVMANTAFTLMIGASIHAATQTRQTRSATWGVALTGANFAGTWGPPGPKGATPAGAMSTYTFRIYLLPPPGSTSNLPPNYWTTELLAGLTNPGRPLPLIASQKLLDPITVSPGSGPWKIMYEVTTYDAVPLLSIDSATPTAGSTVTVTGKYFGMGQPSVELILTPIGSGTVLWNEPAVTLDPNGNFGEYEEWPAVIFTAPSQPGDYVLSGAAGPYNTTTLTFKVATS